MENEISLDSMMDTNPDQGSGVQRELPEMSDGHRQSVTLWQDKITASKKFFEKDFARMREDMKIARQGASDEWIKQGNISIPIVKRYLNQAVAALYAKNPTATAEKRKTLDYKLWDGKPETAQMALEAVMTIDPVTGMPSPDAMALVQDIEQGRQKHEMITKVAETLEILIDYYATEQKPRMKPLMKSLVRRSKTCGVGFMMLGFQRQYAELSPDETAKLEDSRNTLGEIQRRMQDLKDGEILPSEQHEKYELETMIKDMQSKTDKIIREGPKFMFPKSTEMIIDPDCTDLNGFIEAGWIAREFHKTPKDIQKIYQINIQGGYTPYRDNGAGEKAKYHSDSDEDSKELDGMVCIWEVYNKDLGQTFTIADGYAEYLVAPKEPDYWMEGFWPVFALTFNETESEQSLYPFSDTHDLKPVQGEYNRSREYRRLHREANKPKYVAVKGRLSEADKSSFATAPAHSVIELTSLGQGEKIGDLVQRFQSVPIDPALYETNTEMEDTLRIVGAQEANLGGSSGATATEASIGEGSRMTSLASDVDELDEFLSDAFGALGQLMLVELSPETVIEIVGIGAVWPEMDREQIAKQISLKTRAGSSGRPNKAAELANMERGMPYLLQLPGVNPYPLGERYSDLLEIDLDDIIVEGLPSIQAMNSMANAGPTQPATGAEDPNAQGGEGANNMQSTQPNQEGPQAGFTQPIDNI